MAKDFPSVEEDPGCPEEDCNFTLLSPLIPLNSDGTLTCQVAGQNTQVLVDTGASRSTLQASSFSIPISNQVVNAVGISNQVVPHPVSKPVSLVLGPISEHHSFLLSPTSPVNLLGRDLLCRLRCTIFCTPDGVYLEVPAQTRQEVEDLLQGPDTELFPLIPVSDADLLSQVPNCLWATTPNEVGRISVDPVYISVNKTKCLPRITQYPLNPAAEAGIQPVISDLLAQGVLVRCTSECNTPILPIKKPGRDTYRFVQDLRAINAIVISQFPVVPNPTTILSSIPPDSTHFTVVDLSSAFFSVPLHPDCQYLTAFTYKGQQYCWTVLPQGFRDSPTYFSQILRQDLSDITFPSGSTLIQYVDDLLLCSASLKACRLDSVVLLTALANKGHKVSKQKLQLCKPTVRYLGHDLSAGSRHLSADRIQAILSAPKPTTPSQVRSFLGMAGYCRQWIPNVSQLAKPLQELTHNATPSSIPPVHSEEGSPMIPVPLNNTQMNGPLFNELKPNDTWQDKGFTSPGYIRLALTPVGEYCRTCNGTGARVGKSRCKVNIVLNGVWNRNNTWENNKGPYDFGIDGYYLQWMMKPQCQKTLTAKVGHYFICGRRAYKTLPKGWSGTCYVGAAFPAIRITNHLPGSRIRNYREITETQRFWGIAFPGLGVAYAVREIRRLEVAFEKVANATTKALRAINMELGEVRQMVLQNRMALNYVLASKGGVCALVGKECCVYITDTSKEVEEDASKIKKAVERLRNHGVISVLLGSVTHQADGDFILFAEEF
ncbi:retrovirus-related Pol polyprotein from transposon 17.6 [Pelodiscus sinensis]|uniref:retrovirus-related Pol polyprotein from transposon 17.6 n=1 Tax=Pelodiscus sinensis TaxID=13735 RepID=UPI003F6C6556